MIHLARVDIRAKTLDSGIEWYNISSAQVDTKVVAK